MANPLGKTLLSLVAVCVVHGAAYAQDAQDSFVQGIRQIRTGDVESGLTQLRSIGAADLSYDEARAIVEDDRVGVEVLEMLLTMGGEYASIARDVMKRAVPPREEKSRDAAAIESLVDDAVGKDAAARRQAILELSRRHGEFAVPALIRYLANPDESARTDRAMTALVELGRPGVHAVAAALDSKNPVLRRNCALVLSYIGDQRAAGKLAELARDDAREEVRYAAGMALENMGLANASPAELLIADADAYFQLAERGDAEAADVVWHWSDEGLVASDVPAKLYYYELAKLAAGEALQIDPQSDRAAALLADGYLAQARAIESDSDLSEMDGMTSGLLVVAQGLGRAAAGPDAAEASGTKLGEAVEAGMSSLREEFEMPAELTRDLLDDPDARIRFSAALALSQSIESGDTAAGKVVEVLGEAVREEAVRAVLIIDENPLAQRIAKDASEVRGMVVRHADTGRRGVIEFLNSPVYDVVFVSDALSDYLPKDVISLMQARNPNTKFVGIVTSEDNRERLGDKATSTLELETGLNKSVVVDTVLEIADAFDARRSRADSVAVAAASALLDLGSRGFNTATAAADLAEQLDRDDLVSVPAARALGYAGDAEEIASLVGLVADAEISEDLRVAAADGLGGIYQRVGSIEDDRFATLLAVAANDEASAKLRQAVATAIGRAQLTPVQRASLAGTLATIAGVRASM